MLRCVQQGQHTLGAIFPPPPHAFTLNAPQSRHLTMGDWWKAR